MGNAQSEREPEPEPVPVCKPDADLLRYYEIAQLIDDYTAPVHASPASIDNIETYAENYSDEDAEPYIYGALVEHYNSISDKAKRDFDRIKSILDILDESPYGPRGVRRQSVDWRDAIRSHQEIFRLSRYIDDQRWNFEKLVNRYTRRVEAHDPVEPNLRDKYLRPSQSFVNVDLDSLYDLWGKIAIRTDHALVHRERILSAREPNDPQRRLGTGLKMSNKSSISGRSSPISSEDCSRDTSTLASSVEDISENPGADQSSQAGPSAPYRKRKRAGRERLPESRSSPKKTRKIRWSDHDHLDDGSDGEHRVYTGPDTSTELSRQNYPETAVYYVDPTFRGRRDSDDSTIASPTDPLLIPASKYDDYDDEADDELYPLPSSRAHASVRHYGTTLAPMSDRERGYVGRRHWTDESEFKGAYCSDYGVWGCSVTLVFAIVIEAIVFAIVYTSRSYEKSNERDALDCFCILGGAFSLFLSVLSVAIARSIVLHTSMGTLLAVASLIVMLSMATLDGMLVRLIIS